MDYEPFSITVILPHGAGRAGGLWGRGGAQTELLGGAPGWGISVLYGYEGQF